MCECREINILSRTVFNCFSLKCGCDITDNFQRFAPARKPTSLRKIQEKPLPPLPAENLTAEFDESHDILNELSKETVDLLNK